MVLLSNKIWYLIAILDGAKAVIWKKNIDWLWFRSNWVRNQTSILIILEWEAKRSDTWRKINALMMKRYLVSCSVHNIPKTNPESTNSFKGLWHDLHFSDVNRYSYLSNKCGGWNKCGGGAKVAKSINMEVGINVEGGIFWKNLVLKSNKRGVEGGKI